MLYEKNVIYDGNDLLESAKSHSHLETVEYEVDKELT
jgi:hypothetical protein